MHFIQKVNNKYIKYSEDLQYIIDDIINDFEIDPDYFFRGVIDMAEIEFTIPCGEDVYVDYKLVENDYSPDKEFEKSFGLVSYVMHRMFTILEPEREIQFQILEIPCCYNRSYYTICLLYGTEAEIKSKLYNLMEKLRKRGFENNII